MITSRLQVFSLAKSEILHCEGFEFNFIRPDIGVIPAHSNSYVILVDGKSHRGWFQLSVRKSAGLKSVEVEFFLSISFHSHHSIQHTERMPKKCLQWSDEKLMREILRREEKQWGIHCIQKIHEE